MTHYDSPILNGRRYNIEIDSKTNNILFKQQIFLGLVYHMTSKNSSFKKNNEKRDGYFRFKNKLTRIDDVQKNIIGILPF